MYNQIAKRYEYEDNIIENDLPILVHKYQIQDRDSRQLEPLTDYLIDNSNQNVFLGKRDGNSVFFLN